MRYEVRKPLTLAGHAYQPGDVIALVPGRAAVLVREGMLAAVPADPPLIEAIR